MTWEIKHGDALAVLRTIPGESVHCCMTSPPYWGLRDYGNEPTDWPEVTYAMPFDASVTVPAMRCALGLESTPESYVGHIVLGFREVRRVLRKDGTLWLNIGDSYAGNRGNTADKPGADNKYKNANLAIGHKKFRTDKDCDPKRGDAANGQPLKFARNGNGIKEKDLVGIPWLLAFALRSDGWYLRQDIIWAKPNPMPESVTDRCTKSHEYLFLLSKSARYYCDMEAIAEQADVKNHRDAPSARRDPPPGQGSDTGFLEGRYYTSRNKRSVWKIATSPFPEAHFATFPPKLAEPCILAGCPEGGTVLDPFTGAGTTGLVATRLNRNFIGIELNAAYIEMANRRIEQDRPLFNTRERETPLRGDSPDIWK